MRLEAGVQVEQHAVCGSLGQHACFVVAAHQARRWHNAPSPEDQIASRQTHWVDDQPVPARVLSNHLERRIPNACHVALELRVLRQRFGVDRAN